MNESNVQSSRFWDWFVMAGVLLALFFVLASIITPSVGRHRASKGMQTLNGLHQIGIAFTNYATANAGSLPQSRHGSPGYSWRLELCPQLDRSDIARAYRRDAAWDSLDNEMLTSQWVPVMTSGHRPRPCKDASGRGYADFGLITGPGTANPSDGPVTLDYISEHDGLGQTLLVGECSGLQLIWTEPRDPNVEAQAMKLEAVTGRKPDSNALLSSYSTYGVAALFADGSARQLSYDLDPKVLAAICTVDGDESLRYEDLRQ